MAVKEFLKRFLPMPAKHVHEQNRHLSEKIRLIEANAISVALKYVPSMRSTSRAMIYIKFSTTTESILTP